MSSRHPPSGMAFSDLRLSRTVEGDLEFDADAILRICAASGLDEALFRRYITRPESASYRRCPYLVQYALEVWADAGREKTVDISDRWRYSTPHDAGDRPRAHNQPKGEERA